MTRKKGNSLRDSTKETHISSEAPTRGSSHRPRSKVGQILGKVKGSLEDGVNKLRTRSKDSRNRSPVPPHEHASSTPNIKAAPSDVEVEADLQSVIRDTQQAAKRMHPLSGPAITVACAGQDAQTDLNAVDDFQDTCLKPLRIFGTVIAEIGNVWTII
ncbi:hypothetical protein CY34DRAFT_16857 [Suillus luteus UH-Slu-Lm8-n1]|uniref:Uncharacterized protein n=1 Tax=Suillus luteus UH-Slu-Lm8-n1 TaxID=930992 RepID=A0A0D0A1S0_9AGAM|nr:hypothetical protein CY34DRAFT_16857 [Suillus luteus UH-Slu-Lm8-n1]